MASKPKTKFDNWLLTQYEINEPVEVIKHSGPEHRRLYRRDFDKVITSCEFADELKNVEPKQIVSKGHSKSTIANDQQITEHQTTLQNQQVKRNNIWAYGVHRNHGFYYFEKSLFDSNLIQFPFLKRQTHQHAHHKCLARLHYPRGTK